ncbi:MAG: antibiotic biosynthesis monooxygenase [Niveispirillum sp.]|nr:antibiotic biosynthesis monooxygenase [Niveispirillum sp.]
MANALMATVLGLSLGGCAFSTPFKGPGYARGTGVTLSGDGPVVIALSKATLKAGSAGRAQFWDHTSRVHSSLDGQPGLIGYSLRRTLDGSTGWTMTVWRDDESLRAFIRSDVHRTAIKSAMDSLDNATFARFIHPRASVPPTWDEALVILERDGYSYR